MTPGIIVYFIQPDFLLSAPPFKSGGAAAGQGGHPDKMDSRLRKKLMMIGAALLIVLAVAIVVLVSQANRLIKDRLEQALGENFKVENLSLSWNKVEINEPRFMRDGRVTAQAKRIILKPEILDLLKPGFSISSAVLEEPSLTLEIDKGGQWVVPIDAGKKPQTPSAPPGPLSIKAIEIKDGTLVFQDLRRPQPNRIELRMIQLTLDRVAFPLKDAPSTFAFQVQLAGSLVSGAASGSGTIHLETLAVSGKFEGRDIVLLDGGAAGPAARAQGISFTAASDAVAEKPLTLSDLVLIKPYLRLQSDRTGEISSPLPGGSPKAKAEKKEKASVPVEVKNLKIEGGELLYLDGKIAKRPFPVRITDIDLAADQLSFPADNRNTAYTLSARLPGNHGTGVLTSSGKTALKSRDTSARITLRNLDLTSVKPYLLKEGDVDISRGFLDLDVDLGIRKRTIYAPAHSVLRDIQFVGGRGLTDQFLGVPRELVVNALKTNDNQIAFDLVLEGSLDNPKYSLRENMVTRLTVGLAKTLGLTVIETGGAVIIQSGRILKGVGDVIKQIFK
jgi:uncharacterized protein involved in outer membrane biogenesis